MNINFKKYFPLSFLIISTQSLAGGFSNFAIPTRIDIDRGNGFMIYGDFGNPGNCTTANRLYVQKTHPQYDQMYAMALTAFTSGKKIQGYSHNCASVSWYTATTTTYNTLADQGTLYITNGE